MDEDADNVTELETQREKDRRKALSDIRRLRENLPFLIDYYLARVEIQKKVYDKAIEEGFTQQQAFELYKDKVV